MMTQAGAVVVGARIAGVATCYDLEVVRGVEGVIVVDPRPPLSSHVRQVIGVLSQLLPKQADGGFDQPLHRHPGGVEGAVGRLFQHVAEGIPLRNR